MDMNFSESSYLDNYSDFYDDRDYGANNNKKRASNKRRWRDIERFKERSRLAKEIVRDDNLYFDLLELH